jgi:endonuclease-3
VSKLLTKLQTILKGLESAYGQPTSPNLCDPLEIILFENVVYLVSDEKREEAFAALREKIGTNPTSILAASYDTLAKVVRPAAMTSRLVARLREIALITLEEFGGDLQEVISRPLAQAKKALMKFPSIGEPGAEKILLFSNSYPVLALDSNGLRVLIRLGFGEEHKSYVATYRSAQQAAQAELEKDCDLIKRAYLLLRQHGKITCKRAQPKCDSCPLTSVCEYYASHN